MSESSSSSDHPTVKMFSRLDSEVTNEIRRNINKACDWSTAVGINAVAVVGFLAETVHAVKSDQPLIAAASGAGYVLAMFGMFGSVHLAKEARETAMEIAETGSLTELDKPTSNAQTLGVA